jgi:hypothetical protein
MPLLIVIAALGLIGCGWVARGVWEEARRGAMGSSPSSPYCRLGGPRQPAG